jgi:hypothetical protein
MAARHELRCSFTLAAFAQQSALRAWLNTNADADHQLRAQLQLVTKDILYYVMIVLAQFHCVSSLCLVSSRNLG